MTRARLRPCRNASRPLRSEALAAVVTSYDCLGRPACTARVAVPGPNPGSLPVGACISSGPGKDGDASFVLATGTVCGTVTLDGIDSAAVEQCGYDLADHLLALTRSTA